MEINSKLRVSPLATKSAEVKKTKEVSKEVLVNEDTFEKTEPTFAKSTIEEYTGYTKAGTIDDIRAIEEKRMAAFQEMLSRMLGKQGENFNLALFGNKYNVSVEDSQAAANAIADGGEYSVDAVSTRIIDMAKALAGGDKAKIASLRSAVEQGFSAASKSFGGQMPSITNDTYKEVMKRFDDWANEE